jgi:polar amino acid transport system permease protein
MEWDWKFTLEIFPLLIEGAIITIQATLLGTILALLVGLIWAIGRRSEHRAIRYPIIWVTSFIRGTPLLVQLYFLFFVLPDIGIRLDPLVAGIIGLGLHYSTYMAEVYRTGIDNISKGQWEASKAVNLSYSQTWINIIIPQAVPPMIPVLGNYFISMFKETPLLSAITVIELMTIARTEANFAYRYLEPMTMVGIFFLVISIPAALMLKKLEIRLNKDKQIA